MNWVGHVRNRSGILNQVWLFRQFLLMKLTGFYDEWPRSAFINIRKRSHYNPNKARVCSRLIVKVQAHSMKVSWHDRDTAFIETIRLANGLPRRPL